MISAELQIYEFYPNSSPLFHFIEFGVSLMEAARLQFCLKRDSLEDKNE